MFRRETVGYEFDWFACDIKGHVGHFATAGYGSFPEIVDIDLHDAIAEYFQQLSEFTEHQLEVKSKGRLDDWIHMARCGVFSYDWQHYNGPYKRITVPVKPIELNDLPTWIQEGCEQAAFEGLMFSTSNAISTKHSGVF